MAAPVYAGSTIICTDPTTTLSHVVDLVGVQNNATTSFTIAKGANTVLRGGAGTGQVEHIDLRSASGFTVTIVGGGSVTLYLAVASRS